MRYPALRHCRSLLLPLAMIIAPAVVSLGQTITILHGFTAVDMNSDNADGASSQAGLISGSDGYLYGVAAGGGVNGTGVVFRVMTSGTFFQNLHAFDALDPAALSPVNNEGAGPSQPLVIGTDGYLYGTIDDGGPNSGGTIFKIARDGTGFKVLHAFSDLVQTGSTSFGTNADGSRPEDPLVVGPDGYLYGTVRYGCANGTGGIIRMSTDGLVYQVLYNFTDITPHYDRENGSNNDGAMPMGGLLLGKDGMLYGSTNGGGATESGVIFRIGADGSNFTVLYTFSALDSIIDGKNPDGGRMDSPLIQAGDGTFYGATPVGGGNGNGTLFKFTTNGPKLTTLYTFSAVNNSTNEFNNDGRTPHGALVLAPDGNLYGAAIAGGTNALGTLFESSTDGASFHTLYNFDNTNGANPYGPLLSASGNAFYGSAAAGTATRSGCVYSFVPAPLGSGTFTISAVAIPPPDGAVDGSGFVSGSGSFVNGTVEKLSALALAPNVFKGWFADGTLVATSTAYTFSVSADAQFAGYFQQGSLPVQFDLLHVFTPTYLGGGNLDGASPLGGLSASADGYYYGTTSIGGAYADGAIFKMSPDGTYFKTLHSFTSLNNGGANNEGANPSAAVLQGTDSYLYGTAEAGGSNSTGVIYKMSPDGSTFMVLHHFPAEDPNAGGPNTNDDGAKPLSSLAQGPDGYLYGTAQYDGTYGAGTVYKVSPDGNVFQTLHAFDALTYSSSTTGSNNDGGLPTAGLCRANDGLFYGTASTGGTSQAGTIFKIAYDGSGFAVVHTFEPVDVSGFNTEGANPAGALIQAKDGMLYGVTPAGGNGSGTVFRINTNGSGYQVLYTFSDLAGGFSSPDGAMPRGGVVQGLDSLFYGAATAGGSNSYGSIFSVSASGSFSVVYTPNDYEGTLINAPLAAGTDGFLYGVASSGGWKGYIGQLGTIFRTKASPPTGSLTVGILPIGAVAAGARWQVDGGVLESSGSTVQGLSPGSHMVAFNQVSGYTTPASFSVNVSASQTTSASGSYAAVAQTGGVQVTITPPGAVTAGAQWKIDNGSARNSGSTVTGIAIGNHTVSFTNANGYSTPASQNIAVTANQTATATGTYTAVPQTGALQVAITPAGAVSAGAMWQVDLGSAQVSGSTVAGLTTGTHSLSFTAASGYSTPADQVVTIAANQTTMASGTYTAASQTGSLSVTIAPAGAIAAGAMWTVDNGLPQSSGATLPGLATGNHTVGFTSVSGYNTPASQSVNIASSQTTTTSGTYSSIPTAITPFLGTYYAVLSDTSGIISITISKGGKLTGKLLHGTLAQTMKGVFDTMGAASTQAVSKGAATPVSLQLSGSQAAPGSYYISGTAGNIPFTAYHTAYLSHQTVVEAGKVSLTLTPASAGAGIPQTPGTATLTIGKTAAGKLSGKLPDGASFGASGTIIGGPSGNQLLIYAVVTYKYTAAKGAKGIVAGTLTFPGGAVAGPLLWVKPAQTKGTFPAAFQASLNVQ